jgi:hypothetical protein
MGYVESLLADGEVIVLRTRQHWLSVFINGLLGWLFGAGGLVLLVFGLWIRGNGEGWSGSLGNIVSGASGIIILVGAALVAWRIISWRNQDYMVTNRRVLKVEGVLNKRTGDSGLEKINDAVLDQSVVGRLFKYGDLDILTAAEQAIDVFKMLDKPTAFKRTILDQKHLLDEELAFHPTPPLRPSAPVQPGAGPAPAPSATVPAPVPASTDPAAVTQTLNQLADLRDRGAITPEEYETKKAELLKRL